MPGQRTLSRRGSIVVGCFFFEEDAVAGEVDLPEDVAPRLHLAEASVIVTEPDADEDGARAELMLA